MALNCVHWYRFAVISLLYVSIIEVESCYRCLLLKKPAVRSSITIVPILSYAAVDSRPQLRRLRSCRDTVATDVSNFMMVEGDKEEDELKVDDDPIATGSRDMQDDLKDLMISWIKWYRSTLSPIMPPNCRFFPSCSVYAIDSIEKFGSIKGGVLTGWRILRCNPFGGAGYDPPQWPPPGFRAGTNTQRW